MKLVFKHTVLFAVTLLALFLPALLSNKKESGEQKERSFFSSFSPKKHYLVPGNADQVNEKEKCRHKSSLLRRQLHSNHDFLAITAWQFPVLFSGNTIPDTTYHHHIHRWLKEILFPYHWFW